MRIRFVMTGWMFSLALTWVGSSIYAQDTDAVLGSPGGWQRYDWLSPSPSVSSGAPAAGKLTGTAAQATGDSFAVVTNGALWQEKYGATYTRALPGGLTLFYESDAVTLDEGSQSFLSPTEGTPDDLSHGQKAGLSFQPFQQLTLGGNLHDTADDAGSPADSVETRGGGLTAETHLPMNSVLTLNENSETTTTGVVTDDAATDNSYDAQLRQPLGKLPFTAVMKGHYEETSGNTATRLPSLEQSLVWKPAESTTLQMGLRQQQYQSFPGISNELNEAVFADWSQTLLPEITWHSYAEVLNSRGTDVAPAVPISSGANGTAQSADPTNSLAMPTSFSDEAVTFSTGPSFKLDEGVSASVEYSSRIDHNAVPGNAGDDQRVSVSLKGTF